MKYEPGYVYHISDSFFEKVNDNKLMANKENGNFRPTFFCVKDEKTSLLWMVPMSSKVEKYQAIYNKQVEKYGKCITIVLGEFDDKKAAFLLQNMFPISENYLDHIHTKNGNPVPVNSAIQKILNSNMKQIKHLLDKNIKIVFPDVKRIEKIMLDDLEKQGEQSNSSHEQVDCVNVKEKTPFNDILIELHKNQQTKQSAKIKNQDPER